MKQKIITAFIGGLLGILISGYVFYVTGKHYFLLVPAGTFAGCLIGFSIFNFSKITTSVSLVMGKIKIKKINFNFIGKIKNEFIFLINKVKIKKWLKDFYFGLKEFATWFYHAFIKPWGLIPNWIKKHPMNGYMIQEFIVTTVITSVVGYYVYLGLFIPMFEKFVTNSVADAPESSGLVGLLFFIAILCFLGYSYMMFHHIFDRSQKTFYRDFEVYSKYKILGIIGRIIGRFLYTSVAITIGMSLMLGGVILVMFYGITVFIIMLSLWAFFSIIHYISALINEKQELSVLVITVIVTTISYFSYRQYFDNQLLIWLIAFLTGSFSAVAVKLVFSLKAVEKIKVVYQFFNPDYVDIDNRKTYKKNLIGLLLFMPVSWLINIFDKGNEKILNSYIEVFA